jgi:hypothetical protein
MTYVFAAAVQFVALGVAKHVEIRSNKAFRLVPTAAAPTTMTNEINATNKPYSIAVAPCWLRVNRLNLYVDFMLLSMLLCKIAQRDELI